MSPPIDSARYLQGLSARLAMGKSVIRREDITTKCEDVDDISLNALWSFFDQTQSTPLALQICRVCLKFKSIPEQQRFLEQFRSHPIAELTKLLTIGTLFKNPQYPDGKLAVGDYSIIELGAVIANEAAHQNLLRETQRGIKVLMSTCEISPAKNVNTLQAYFQSFNIADAQFRDIHRLASSFQQFKELYWPLVGPDLLSGLQALCDPLQKFSHAQLYQLERLATLWGLRGIAYRLIAVRALGGHESELAFLNSERVRRLSLNPSLQMAVEALLFSRSFDGYVRCTAKLDLFSYIIASFVNIGLATRNKDEVILKRQVANLFQRDSQAHLFLNWELIHRTFELPASQSDVYSIFLKLLMLHPTVGKRFITVALARGKGHLVADLSSFISRIRIQRHPNQMRTTARANIEFVKRIGQLPPTAAARLMEEVLDKGMMERLAFAFPTTISLASDMFPRVDNQASVLRLELANLALRANVLSDRIAGRIIEDETHLLRMHKFHVLFREGRIKLDWEYLGYLTEFLIEEKFDFLLSEPGERSIDNSVQDNVVRLFSEELSDILLFDSESSLEQALNNNVRHGVLVPRFVKEFNEALVATIDFDGNPGDLSDDTYARFGPNAKHLLKLKEDVTGRINAYKDFWLTVQREGDFHKSTRDLIRSIIAKIDRDANSGQLSKAIIEQFEPQVEGVLKEALHEFIENVKPSVLADIRTARLKCSKSPSENATTFLDILETKLELAFVDIRDWLGLAKITTDVPDFELMDLIRFEAVSLIFSDFKKLHFTHASFLKRNGKLKELPKDPRFKGRYFEVTQEIIHNLISNALKHSGLGMKTEIDLSFVIDDSDLIFKCTNSFASKNYAKISSTIASVNRMILTADPSQGKKDELSGFSKIKNVCSRVLSEEVTITIPPLARRMPRFSVEITIPNVTGYVLA